MGVLRFLLALAVVFAHTAPPFGLRMTFGTNSVQAFYIVSGFLITLVLNKKYDQSRAFYEARFFRIFPTYWVFLLMEISIQLAQLAGAPLQSMMTLSFFQQN
ncbi:acyltransferase family protein [Azospirillum himalayense]|uniref:Acyltransferase family protein n=1 Tax=Azospirillum himalayense TaxID=654847 RepID=A0ABW0FZY3_9PROT